MSFAELQELQPPTRSWNNGFFMLDKHAVENQYDITTSRLLSIAYLKSVRDMVVGRNFSYLASFDGRHRSGKSLGATTFGYLWDKTFWKNYESRLPQEPKEFIDCIEKINKEKIKGAVIQVDEAGVSMASSDWYEGWMKTITKTVQMFGYLNPIVLFVAPVKDFVDSRLRKMFHTYYNFNRVRTDYTTIRIYNTRYSTIKKKEYLRKPTVRIMGQRVVLDSIRLGLPPQFIIDRYTELSHFRKDKMLDGFIAQMKKGETKKSKDIDVSEIIRHTKKNYHLYEASRSSKARIILDQTRIEFGLKIPAKHAKYVKTEVENELNEKLKELMEVRSDTNENTKSEA
jgi:hypothetical protein